MKHTDLTQFDELPKDMVVYLRNYGPHFNKKLSNYAASLMTDRKGQRITSYTKDEVSAILKDNNITVNNDILYDKVYVANMIRADFYGSSITDDYRLALMIKDILDDEDGYDGIAFNRWYADMSKKGIGIEWSELI